MAGESRRVVWVLSKESGAYLIYCHHSRYRTWPLAVGVRLVLDDQRSQRWHQGTAELRKC